MKKNQPVKQFRVKEMGAVFRQAMIYAILTALVMALFIFSIFIGREIFQTLLGLSSFLAGLFAAMVVVLGFRPLENLIIKIIDKVFFRSRYNYQKAIIKAGWEVGLATNLGELEALLIDILTNRAKIKDPRLFILEKSNGQFKPCLFTRAESNVLTQVIDCHSPLALLLQKRQKPLVLEEINYRIKRVFSSRGEVFDWQLIKKQIISLQATALIPLLAKQELVGVFVLGPKLSGSLFTNFDVSLLSNLAKRVAVALKNIRLVNRLEGRVKELEKFHRLTIGRELKMIELKRALKEVQGQNNKV